MCRFILVVLSVLLCSATSPILATDWSAWETYAKASYGRSGTLTLQVRTRAGSNISNTRVQWQVINGVAGIYDVSIEDKEYVCSNGKKFFRSGERITNSLPEGESKRALPDNLNTKECPRVTGLRMVGDKDFFVKYSYERHGSRVGWGTGGTVTIY